MLMRWHPHHATEPSRLPPPGLEEPLLALFRLTSTSLPAPPPAPNSPARLETNGPPPPPATRASASPPGASAVLCAVPTHAPSRGTSPPPPPPRAGKPEGTGPPNGTPSPPPPPATPAAPWRPNTWPRDSAQGGRPRVHDKLAVAPDG